MRIVYDDAAINRLLDRAALNNLQEEEEGEDDDFTRAFKVGGVYQGFRV